MLRFHFGRRTIGGGVVVGEMGTGVYSGGSGGGARERDILRRKEKLLREVLGEA